MLQETNMSTEVNASELITHRFGLDGIQEAIRLQLAADTSLKLSSTLQNQTSKTTSEDSNEEFKRNRKVDWQSSVYRN